MVFRNNRQDGTPTELIMALGGSGGPKIITAVVQVLLNHLILDMPLFEAMAAPRLHDQLLYHNSATSLFEHAQLGRVMVEVPERIRDDLRKRGHRLVGVDYTGCVQAVAVAPGNDDGNEVDKKPVLLNGVSDIRKQGTPAGY